MSVKQLKVHPKLDGNSLARRPPNPAGAPDLSDPRSNQRAEDTGQESDERRKTLDSVPDIAQERTKRIHASPIPSAVTQLLPPEPPADTALPEDLTSTQPGGGRRVLLHLLETI